MAFTLMQVIKESLRMFPVAATGLSRCTDEDTVLGGYLIPAGTEVQVWQCIISCTPTGHLCSGVSMLCILPAACVTATQGVEQPEGECEKHLGG